MSPQGGTLSLVFQVQKLHGVLSGLSSRLTGTQRIEEGQKGIESLSFTGPKASLVTHDHLCPQGFPQHQFQP